MNHHHPIKKLNLPSQSPNMRISLYDNIKHHHNLPSTTIITAPTYNRLLTRKIPHSLDKLNKKHYQLDTSPLQKQLITPNAKKLSSYQSTKNIHRNNPALTDNNNNNNDITFTPAYHHLNNFTTIMNRSALGINNINNSTSNINNYTHSNLNNQSSSKVKERLIHNLKNNFSQERIHKKKMLNVNVNVNFNQHYAMINNNNNTTDTNGSSQSGNANNAQHHAYTHSLYDNNTISNISLYKRNYFGKKEQPLKLYTDANAFNTHSNSNKKKSNNIDNRHTNSNNNNNCSFGDAFDNSKLINSNSHNNLSLSTSNVTVVSTIIEKFIELESKMTKLLKENKTNSKSKKYNIAKQIFEEAITHITTITTFLSKHLPDNNNNKDTSNPYIIPSLLKTIIKTYHESFFAFSTENKILRENVEKCQSSTFHLEKRLLDVSKQLKQKESEIDSLKSQITKLSKQQQHILTPNRNNNISSSLTTNSPSITQQQQQQQQQLQLQMPCDPRQVTFSALDDDLVNSSNPPLNRHQALIKDYNTKNVNDLDALYFNDKVEMKESTRDTAIIGASSAVPKLNLNTMHNGNGSSNSSNSIGLVNISFNANKIINKGNI